MRINIKSSFEEKQLKARANVHKNIELQLFNDFNEEQFGTLYNRLSSFTEGEIRVIHSPIIETGDTNIEFIGNKAQYDLIEKTIYMAAILSNRKNENIKVVLHYAFDSMILDDFPEVYKEILEFCDRVITTYPRVELCIENVIPCQKKGKEFVYFRNGVLFDNITLVKRLRKDIGTDRIGTVLDTCHAMTTIEAFNRLFKGDYPEFLEGVNLEEYFKRNAEYIKLIHLADVKGLGLHKGEHGILFTDKRMDKLREIIRYYKKYNYDCDITIEIVEEDYLKSNNFKDNRKKLISVLKENGITVEE